MSNIKTNLDEDSYENIEWHIYNIRALTFKAKTEGCFKNIWALKNLKDEEEGHEESRDDDDEMFEAAAISQ